MSINAEPTPQKRADAADDRWIGRTIDGTFRLERLLGEGAMGKVYGGEQLSLGKPIAIKILHPHLSHDPRVARRFHREAKAASRLSHPNSVQIIDFGEDDDGTLFIAMELLEGEDLQTIIDHDCPLTPARVANVMKQTLSALDEAHHRGIIHRDLKPENVLVLPLREGHERVKVCDFGIAKITEYEGSSTAITKDGYVCGTPEYMAPEQARGEEIDSRADIYSAGVMLYQLLTGTLPFRAENALGIITKHLMDPPKPPRRVRPTWGIPRSLQRITLKALAKSPDDRYASAAEMSKAIDEAMIALGDLATTRLSEGVFASDANDEDDEEAHGPSSTRDVIAKVVPAPNRNWMYALAFGLCALAGTIIWYGRRDSAPTSPPIGGASTHDADRVPAAPPTPVNPPGATPSPTGPTGPPLAPAASELAATTSGTENSPATPQASAGSDPPAPAASDPGSASPASAAANGRPDSSAAGSTRPATSSARPASTTTSASTSTSTRPRHAPRRRPRETPAATPAAPSALSLGRQAMLDGHLRDAISHFERAARAHPRDPQPQKQLGRAYMRAGNVSRSVAAYRRYLRLAPNAPDRAIIERILAQHGG